MVLDDSSDPVEFARTVPHVLGNGNRPQSELGQTIVSLDVNVVGFDAVGHEHEQPVRTSSKECRHERPRERGRRVLKVSVETHPSVIAAIAPARGADPGHEDERATAGQAGTRYS